MARMLGCTPDLADDLTQESFAIALTKGATDRDPPATAAFLRQTARFLYLRTLARTREVETIADAATELNDEDLDDAAGGRRNRTGAHRATSGKRPSH